MNLITTLVLLIFMHPLHITLTNINIDEANRKVQVTTKIFSDDFATVLQNYSKKEIVLNTENETKDINKIISAYFNHRFSIFFDNKKVDFKYVSKKNNFEATWVSFEAEYFDCRQIKIQNSILLDLYEDQKNLVIIKNNRDEKGYNMDFDQREVIITQD